MQTFVQEPTLKVNESKTIYIFSRVYGSIPTFLRRCGWSSPRAIRRWRNLNNSRHSPPPPTQLSYIPLLVVSWVLIFENHTDHWRRPGIYRLARNLITFRSIVWFVIKPSVQDFEYFACNRINSGGYCLLGLSRVCKNISITYHWYGRKFKSIKRILLNIYV